MKSKNDENLVKENQKVAKFYFGTDEVVVTKSLKRLLPKGSRSEGLH
jgi:hypothetical protein